MGASCFLSLGRASSADLSCSLAMIGGSLFPSLEMTRFSSLLMPCLRRPSLFQPALENHLFANLPYDPLFCMTSVTTVLAFLRGFGIDDSSEVEGGLDDTESASSSAIVEALSSSSESLLSARSIDSFFPCFRALRACEMASWASDRELRGIRATSVMT